MFFVTFRLSLFEVDFFLLFNKQKELKFKENKVKLRKIKLFLSVNNFIIFLKQKRHSGNRDKNRLYYNYNCTFNKIIINYKRKT